MPFSGTYQPNRRPVIATAPDCLVYLNGQLALPSGGNPTKRVNIQPYVTSVSTSLGIENSPGNASISMHIPRHVKDDFYRGGNLILTTMMEVQIYIKGHYLVGGAPRYYPAFWGVVTSVNEGWSGGEQTIDLACQDILYWWNIQRINVNPSHQAASTATQGSFNTRGSGVFTGKNPFDIMYSLSRYAYGDSVNANFFLNSRQMRTEPTDTENLQLMAYWTKQWGRIGYALKMFGPSGDVLQGDLLASVLSDENFQSAFQGRQSRGARNRSKNYAAFAQGGSSFAQISSFTEALSRVGSFDLFTSEFQTKKEIADTTKTAIGYEFFMDTTGEIIFKPPFYNLDVYNNKPVSWIHPIDLISESYAENPADVTFLEGTGSITSKYALGEAELTKPKATYVDYRLVQKYGWKPGSYNSEFFGAGLGGNASRNLFYHLVDELDRQNARVNSGSVTIPIRPELRLGYPVFIENRDAYYYIEGISNNFSYSGNCTTSLTLMAKRAKFYAAFSLREGTLLDPEDLGPSINLQPSPGDLADPGQYPANLYSRPIDPLTGNPVGDRNVVLTPVKETAVNQDIVASFEDGETQAEAAYRDVVSFRSQFRIFGDFNYAYKVDDKRDEVFLRDDKGVQTQGPLQQIDLQDFPDRSGKTQKAAVFPVSDNRGYEVIGSYLYGRNVQLGGTFRFDVQADNRSLALLHLTPDTPDTTQNQISIDEESLNPLAKTYALDPSRSKTHQISPNNYGRRLFEISPLDSGGVGSVAFARGVGLDGSSLPEFRLSIPQQVANIPASSPLKQVGQWADEIEIARNNVGVSAEQYPTEVILAFIQTESLGQSNARRTKKNGQPSQFNGILQIGTDNAKQLGRTNTEFRGTDVNDSAAAIDSIEHFIKYQELFTDRHGYDPSRMAIVWKGGPGTAKTYKRMVESGASESALLGFLDERWNTDEYVRRIQSGLNTWGGKEFVEIEQVDRPLTPEEEAYVNELGFPPEPGDVELSTLRFKSSLEANSAQDVTTLPSFFKPVRDPSIMPILNTFLQNIYNQAFDSEDIVEKELRGITRNRIQLPRPADVVTNSEETFPNSVVSTPLSREEVQTALDNGSTLEEAFGPGSRWGEVEEQYRDSQSQFNSAGEAITSIRLSNLNPLNNGEDS
jgi:hypothetical protein